MIIVAKMLVLTKIKKPKSLGLVLVIAIRRKMFAKIEISCITHKKRPYTVLHDHLRIYE